MGLGLPGGALQEEHSIFVKERIQVLIGYHPVSHPFPIHPNIYEKSQKVKTDLSKTAKGQTFFVKPAAKKAQ